MHLREANRPPPAITVSRKKWLLFPVIAAIFFLNPSQISAWADPPPSPFSADQPAVSPKIHLQQQSVGKQIQTLSGLGLGWNLVSFQVLPGDRSPASVLSGLRQGSNPVSLPNAVDSLWCYDSAAGGWLTWSPSGETNEIPGVGIQHVDHFKGYWLKLKLPNLQLQIDGAPPSDGRMTLPPGWNLVAFDSGDGGDDLLADVQSVFGANVDTVEPTASRVRLVYLLSDSLEEDPLLWDPFNDRAIGDTTQGLPPGNEPGTPNIDTLLGFAHGRGYWVLISPGAPVVLQPTLRTILPADSDVDPTGNFPGPEDTDVDGDGVLDSSTWTFPQPETPNVQSSIVFPPDSVQREVLVRNAGNGILAWRAHVNPEAAGWLSLSPPSGRLLRGTDLIAVTVNRGSLPGPEELQGFLTLETTGGSRSIDVRAFVPDLEGDYIGAARMTTVDGKTIPMPTIDLSLSLERASDGTLRGLISADESLSIPVNVPLAGGNYRSTGSDFTLSGAYLLPGSGRDTFDIDDFNPLPDELRREFRLTGLRSNENFLEGEFLDTLHGVLDRPINVAGSFVLERSSLTPTLGEGSTVSWDPVGGTFGTETKRFTVNIPTRTLVETVRVSVDIAHPRTSDLEIWLEGPAQPGKGAEPPIRVLLFDQSNGVDLITSWPDESFPAGGADALDAFKGIIGQGNWVLEITDSVEGPVGTQRLRSFELEVRGPTVHSVEGVVRDSNSNPLSNAFVGITGGVFTPYTITGPDGSFRFDFLTPNLYKATASLFGYDSVNGQGQTGFYLGSNLSGVELVLTKKAPAAPTLLATPAEGVAPGRIRLTYASSQSPGPSSFQFILQRFDLITGDPVGGQITMDSGQVGTALFTGLEAGIYVAGVIPQGGAILINPSTLTIRPTAALETPNGSFRLAGMFGMGGGVIPGVYTPPNANPAFPPVSNVVLSEHMVDATTFDNDRLAGDGPFPVGSGSTNPFDQVDTDVRLVPAVPPTHLNVLGVGRISYSLLQGERGGDLDFDGCSQVDGQTWGCFRMTTCLGAVISGFSEGGSLSLVGGGRPFPPDWGPNRGQP